MKIEISTKEILDFMEGGDVTSLKEKLSGALLAAADTSEMKEAVSKRTEQIIKGAFDNAFNTQQVAYGGSKLDGWATSIIREWLSVQLRSRSVEAIVRNVAKEAVREILPDLVQQTVQAIVHENGGSR